MANVGPTTWYLRAQNGAGLYPATVAGTVNGNTGTTLAMTGVTIPSGALIVVVVAEQGVTAPGSCADGTNGAYTNTNLNSAGGVAIPGGTGNGFGSIYYFENSAALTSATITYTRNTTGKNTAMSVIYLTGIKTSGSFDATFQAFATGTSTTPSVTSSAPAQAFNIAIGALFYQNAGSINPTLQTSWGFPPVTKNTYTTNQVSGGWLATSTTDTVTFAPTFGSSSNWVAAVAAFKLATNPAAGWEGGVTPWASGAVVAAGVLRRQRAPVALGSKRVFVCITAGTTGGTEPVWVVTKGAKSPSDNGVIWQECTGQPGVNGDATSSPTWTQNKNIAVTLGLVIYDSVSLSLQIVTTAGTTGNGSLPGFSATAGVTTSDNSVVWTSLGLASNFGAWAAPFATMQDATATGWAGTIPDSTLLVASDHLEQTGASYTLNPPTQGPPLKILCVDKNAALPPTSTTTGAIVNGTTLNIKGNIATDGIEFNSMIPGNNLNISTFMWTARNTVMKCSNSSANFGSLPGTGRVEWIGGTIKIDGVAVSLNSNTRWRGVTVLGTFSTTSMFSFGGNGDVSIEDCDLSAYTGLTTLFTNAASNSFGSAGGFQLQNCRLPTGVAIGTPGITTFGGDSPIFIVNCDDGTNVKRHEKWSSFGSQVLSTAVVRTGGSQTGGGTSATFVPVSWKVDTNAFCTWSIPWRCMDLGVLNSVTGANVTVTLYGVANAAALPTNKQVRLLLSYFGSASSTLGTAIDNGPANGLLAGTPLTADSTSVWNSAATARVNSHTYSTGDIISVSSNNRVFFCTAGGTASGSLPVGYATAVDGGTVTDGAATFRAGVRFTIAILLSSPQPQLAGMIEGLPKIMPSLSLYLDPKLYLS